MAKKCPEEFNPWPPFVDIFASVILVMLLFLLITIVNIGYYAQFKSKMSYTASVTKEAPIQPEDQTKVISTLPVECTPSANAKDETESAFSFHKVAAPRTKDSKNSLFSGGKEVGNAVSYESNKKDYANQKLSTKDLRLTIQFQDKEIFLSPKIKRDIKRFIASINRRSKHAIFTILVSDPENIISSTLTKQISLGRVLNVKSIVHRAHINSKNIRMDLQHEIPSENQYGNIIIKVHIP